LSPRRRTPIRYVGFLRAVNVGARRVDMARLRAELEGLGYDDVSTYINSGNVIFSSPDDPDALTSAIEARLEAAFGFEVATLLRTDDEVAAIAARRPFGAVPEGSTHMVVLLRQPLAETEARAVEGLSRDSDRLRVEGTEVHWLITGKLMDSTLKAKDWKVLGEQATTNRNHTMVVKLANKLAT
jgi:uncharacterized protein (DUF1697 family)